MCNSVSPVQGHAGFSATELRAGIEVHLRNTQLSFSKCQGRHVLCIPGHAPMSWPSRPRRGQTPDFYEETTTLVLNYLLERFNPSVFFDIGADAGYFSRVAASFKANVHAHAFEMRPEKISKLRALLRNDSFGRRVEVHHVAVSDAQRPPTPVWFARSLVFEQLPASAEYREPWWLKLKFLLRGDRTRGLSQAIMPVTTIDDFAAGRQVWPDIIKIDVEGYEGRVIQGGLETFGKRRPFVLLELHRDQKLRFGTNRADVVKVLFDVGYEALFFTDHQSKASCEIVQVEPASHLLARQETDLLLFAHPDFLAGRP